MEAEIFCLLVKKYCSHL